MALTQMQVLILWALLAKPGGGSLQKEIKPDVKKSDRDALVKAGLVASEKRGRGLWLEVTDKGWAWAGDHLDAELPARSIHGAAILHGWLKRLMAFMRARDLALADIVGPQAPVPAAEPASLRDRIRLAYLEATGGRLNQRVFLDVLRERLKEVDRATLDDALRKLHLEDGAHLSGSDNPPEITPAIRDASLDYKGERMVVLWMTK